MDDPPVNIEAMQHYMLPETDDGYALTPKFEWLQTAIKDMLRPNRNSLVYRIDDGK